MKKTSVAPSNIALIKYWGKKDEKLRLPANSSVSVNLSGIYTKTTVEFSKDFLTDEFFLNHQKKQKGIERIISHLDRVRKIADINYKAKVETENNFPTASGLASSASGFAALTQAAVAATGLNISEKELSKLARLGSGSACRSIPDGFVEWQKGEDDNSSYAFSIFPQDYWDLSIIAVLVSDSEKKISSTKGHKLTKTSPFFPVRLEKIEKKVATIKQSIKMRNFLQFGQIVENESLEMHSIMLTSTPSLIYWQPETVGIMKLTQNLREKGLPVFFTIDAGPHPYLITEGKNEKELIKQLKNQPFIRSLIANKPSEGARIIS